jgi:hypothetical protein
LREKGDFGGHCFNDLPLRNCLCRKGSQARGGDGEFVISLQIKRKEKEISGVCIEVQN